MEAMNPQVRDRTLELVAEARRIVERFNTVLDAIEAELKDPLWTI